MNGEGPVRESIYTNLTDMDTQLLLAEKELADKINDLSQAIKYIADIMINDYKNVTGSIKVGGPVLLHNPQRMKRESEYLISVLRKHNLLNE